MISYNEFAVYLTKVYAEAEGYRTLHQYIKDNSRFAELEAVNPIIAEKLFSKLACDIDGSWNLYTELCEWLDIVLELTNN